MKVTKYPEVGWPKERFQILQLSEAVCEFDWTLEPGGSVPAHFHQESDELFHVLLGELTVKMDGQKKVVKTGETLLIPKMTPHNVSNRTKENVICRVSFEPAADQGKLFEILFFLKERIPKDKNVLFKALFILDKVGFKEFSTIQGGLKYLMLLIMSVLKILAPFNGLTKLAKDFTQNRQVEL